MGLHDDLPLIVPFGLILFHQSNLSLIDEIKLNQKEQLEAGHHGVPLTVYKDKFFFGQDRFNDLLRALKKDGLEL